MAIPLAGKVLLDTNVFIDYLRLGAHEQWVHGRVARTVRFLSSVVLMELRLGADTLPRQRAIDRVRAAFPDSRVIAPAAALFDDAGLIFRKMFPLGAEARDRLGPVNDLLIALTARHIGAAIVTSNESDFRRIGQHLPGLTIVDPGDA